MWLLIEAKCLETRSKSHECYIMAERVPRSARVLRNLVTTSGVNLTGLQVRALTKAAEDSAKKCHVT